MNKPFASFRLRQFAAWAPGASSADEWNAWARGELMLGRDGQPDVGSLPAMLRRRCGRLSRMMFHTALRACPEEEQARVRLLFGSRHGELVTTVKMLEALADGEPLSPTDFSHSVHNAPAGLFSIATGNRVGNFALAAGADTFCCTLLEAVLSLREAPDSPVLLVVADDSLPNPFDRFADEDQTPYALALLLDSGVGEGREMELQFDVDKPGDPPATGPDVLPQALMMLRWLLRGEQTPLSLATQDHTWILWDRVDVNPRSSA